MKTVLIISPYFAPSNAADMHRIRTSLPYFEENGWLAEVVIVDQKYSEAIKDPLLMKSFPSDIILHKVAAFPKRITGKFGLGSLGLRSLYFYKGYVNKLLRTKKYDLIYFSTTEFSITTLGGYWKKKFKIPYVIDLQDAWHTTYYQDKPSAERPKKYWFSYRLNKYLEPRAMKDVDGLISVSEVYLKTLITRYPILANVPMKVITFGASKTDFKLVADSPSQFILAYNKEAGTTNLLYIGRGGHDLKEGLTLLFKAFKKGLKEKPNVFELIRFHFIGTSYAPKGTGMPTIKPLAIQYGIEDYVTEQTDRISFYENIYNLSTADGLLIIGSNDPAYTASKIYPYILAKKPLLAFFHPDSSAAKILADLETGPVISLLAQPDGSLITIYNHLLSLVQYPEAPVITNWKKFEEHSAQNRTSQQAQLFNQVLELKK